MTSAYSSDSPGVTKHHITIGDCDVPVVIADDKNEMSERALAMTSEEAAWLEEYCNGLRERFADDIEQVIVYGFRARGVVHEDLSLNTLVVISEGNRATADEVSDIGYRLDMSKYSVAPSITSADLLAVALVSSGRITPSTGRRFMKGFRCCGDRLVPLPCVSDG